MFSQFEFLWKLWYHLRGPYTPVKYFEDDSNPRIFLMRSQKVKFDLFSSRKIPSSTNLMSSSPLHNQSMLLNDESMVTLLSKYFRTSNLFLKEKYCRVTMKEKLSPDLFIFMKSWLSKSKILRFLLLNHPSSISLFFFYLSKTLQ